MKENQFETFPRENSSAAITHQTPPSLDKTHLILSFIYANFPY
ncbi:Hypothetical protein Cp12C_1718 [Corynebacterium pseudotuberculosis]|nr:Hypothetical protein Cp12C_1718 [Corynebacterium pseudotuberculosis]